MVSGGYDTYEKVARYRKRSNRQASKAFIVLKREMFLFCFNALLKEVLVFLEVFEYYFNCKLQR